MNWPYAKGVKVYKNHCFIHWVFSLTPAPSKKHSIPNFFKTNSRKQKKPTFFDHFLKRHSNLLSNLLETISLFFKLLVIILICLLYNNTIFILKRLSLLYLWTGDEMTDSVTQTGFQNVNSEVLSLAPKQSGQNHGSLSLCSIRSAKLLESN